MKKLVEEGGFKPEHARSGFVQSGLFPLCRDKITEVQMAIGSVFREEENPLVAGSSSSPKTSYRYSPYSTPNKENISTEKSNEKLIKREKTKNWRQKNSNLKVKSPVRKRLNRKWLKKKSMKCRL